MSSQGPGEVESPLKVAVVITRMITGGAQRVALEGLARLPQDRFRGTLITGPEGGAEASLLPEARERGLSVEIVPELGREIAPLRDWQAYQRLLATFRRNRYDVVHSHTSKAGLLASVAARRAGVPAVVYSPHGHIFGKDSGVLSVSDAGLLKRNLLLRLRRWAQRSADRVIALSHLDRDEQVQLGLSPADKYTIIRNGIDLDRYAILASAARARIRARFHSDPEALVISIVGRLGGEKGHSALFEAAARLKDDPTVPPIVIWVIGDGYLRRELEQEAERTLPLGSVSFLGMREDVPTVLGASDVMVLPSRYESQGLVFMEASATGVPVIGTRVGGIPEVVRDEKTGLLVEPGNVGDLANAIRRLARDAGLRQTLGATGHVHARAAFGIDRMVHEITGLYESLLHRKER